jgi:hypothetical protein
MRWDKTRYELTYLKRDITFIYSSIYLYISTSTTITTNPSPSHQAKNKDKHRDKPITRLKHDNAFIMKKLDT